MAATAEPVSPFVPYEYGSTGQRWASPQDQKPQQQMDEADPSARDASTTAVAITTETEKEGGPTNPQQEEDGDVPAVKSIIATVIICTVGGLVIAAGSQGSCNAWNESTGVPVFALCGILSFVINWIAFIPAFCLHTEKFYDLVGGFTHIAVMLLGVILSWHTIDYRGISAAVCVTLWAVRLAGYLFLRISADGGGDSRFDKIKYNGPQFFMTWSLQGLWVTINTTCALALVTTRLSPEDGYATVTVNDAALDILCLCGLGLWLFGWLYEVVADEQKRRWRKIPTNKGKWIDVGLWHYCRHPNYFGEITLWIGLAVASLPILFDYRWVMLISPLFCCFLLTCVSGVPMLTAKAKKKWGDDPQWQLYMATTPALIPGPPACF